MSNKIAVTVLAHRDGREKELTKKLTPILPLMRTAVKSAVVMLGSCFLAAMAALNIPAMVSGVLTINALLGMYLKSRRNRT